MRGAGKHPAASPAAESLASLPTRGGSRLLAAVVVFSAVALVAGCGGNAVGMLSGAAPVAGDDNETLSGAARVIDADTIEVGGERVRLMGIDAPERNQHCRDGAGRSYPCGAEATAALRRRIGGADVRCEASGRDGYGRPIAVCFAADGLDLNGWLVREGHALAYRRFSQDYVGDEEAARCARRGVWEGTFVPPWDWRKGERLPERDCRCAPGDDGSGSAPSPSRDDAPPDAAPLLELWDDNGNGRISCREARRHGIAPVPRDHPAYAFMRDGDGDGVVCEAPGDDGPGSAPSPSRDDAPSDDAPPLKLWDDDGNGRISCREARRHGIAPVPRGHPAYEFMRDGDGDGVVCE